MTMKIRSVFTGLASGAVLALSAAGASADGGRSVTDAGYRSGYNWSGIYGGLSVGWQSTDIDGVVTNFTGGGAAPPNQNWNIDPDSGTFGGIIGIQHQFGSFVVGVEANFSRMTEYER